MSVYIAGIDGKLKKVAGNFVPKENPNLDCLRTETVYDMSSSDANKNWGYANGIGTGKVISGKDFSRYDKLIIHATFENTTSGTGILDLSHKLSGTGTYRTKLIFGPASSNHVYYYCFVRVDGDKTEFANGDMGYSSTTETGQLSSSTTFISKIEGVLTSPAMIYTGAELHEGNGISIKDGVISKTEPTKLNTSNIAVVGSRSGNVTTYTNVSIPLSTFQQYTFIMFEVAIYSGTARVGKQTGILKVSELVINTNTENDCDIITFYNPRQASVGYLILRFYDNYFETIASFANPYLTDNKVATASDGIYISNIWGLK